MKKNNLLFLFLFLLLGFSCSQKNITETKSTENIETSIEENNEDEEHFVANHGVFQNKIYDKKIKTVMATKAGWNLSNPAIELKPGEAIKFSFDKIGANIGDYYYTLIHCTSDWKKSDIPESQYMTGFFQDFLSNYKFAFNTYESYVHYELTIPNKNTQIKLSGNYVLKIFQENDPENIVLTKRFMVYENKVTTSGKVNRPSNVQERNYKQEVDFEIDTKGLIIRDLNRDLKVIVQQNNRWDNAITNLKPRFVRGNKLDYNYNNGENLFNGGNEYRFVDLRNLRFRGPKIQQILLENRETNVYLFAEEKRRFKTYLFYEDVDGKFVIKNKFAVKQNIESDYVHTHFALNYQQELANSEVYVFGGLSDNEFREEFKMTYNVLAEQYETSAFLKQGYYDYHYVVKKEGEPGDETIMEGDHFETENLYTIITYFQDPVTDCERIVGYFTFKSNLR